MGEIADMMIEAMQNDGWVDGIRIDTETGEVLEVEDDEPRRNWKERDNERMNGYIERLRAQGFSVYRFDDYHIQVNGVLDVWCGKNGTSSRRRGGKMVYSRNRSQGVINTVHRFFHYQPKK
jgi:hypothetical protein